MSLTLKDLQFAFPTAVQHVREALQDDVYDVRPWQELLQYARNVSLDEARSVFEAFLRVFPTCAWQWLEWIRRERQQRNYDRVEALFSRCLQQCLDVPLYMEYLSYVVEARGTTKEEIGNVIAAFKFALLRVGDDVTSGAIWQRYLSFLRACPAETETEKAQRTAAIRDLYQRAIGQAITDVEALMRDYDRWENDMNPQFAANVVAAHRDKFLKAKLIARERRRLWKGINRDMLARPPTRSDEFAQEKEYRQVQLWRAVIDLERANHQMLSAADLHRRVDFCYRRN
ncbi:MAG: hypothetical protein MHM6MM_006679 [Cercozoa sp. M6MM]